MLADLLYWVANAVVTLILLVISHAIEGFAFFMILFLIYAVFAGIGKLIKAISSIRSRQVSANVEQCSKEDEQQQKQKELSEWLRQEEKAGRLP